MEPKRLALEFRITAIEIAISAIKKKLLEDPILRVSGISKIKMPKYDLDNNYKRQLHFLMGCDGFSELSADLQGTILYLQVKYGSDGIRKHIPNIYHVMSTGSTRDILACIRESSIPNIREAINQIDFEDS